MVCLTNSGVVFFPFTTTQVVFLATSTCTHFTPDKKPTSLSMVRLHIWHKTVGVEIRRVSWAWMKDCMCSAKRIENIVSNLETEAMRGNLNFIDVECSKIGRFFVMVK